MALNAFTLTGGANVSVSSTPLAVQVAGPTILIANIGQNTVYGSLGGSASGSLNPGGPYLSGQLGGAAVPGGNTATGFAGIAVFPGQQVAISAGANTWLWLATLSGLTGAVNVANGT
jgi:hypothetical protein